MPKISVIVPVYNVEKYVEKCLRSVLGQSFGDFELLVVDDGSPDGSGAICDRLAQEDPRVRVVHQENQGLGGARNTGIKEAAGQWLLFVDSDDWLEPQTLERTYDAAEKHGADMVMFAFQSVDEEGRVLRTFAPPVAQDKPLSAEEWWDMLFNAPCAWNKLYRADLFEKTGALFPPRVWYEDVRTTPKLAAACGRVVYTGYVGYNYLQRAGSIMANLNLERNIEILEAFDDLLGYFREKGLFERYKDELCYMTFLHTYLEASVRIIRSDRKSALLPKFRRYAEEAFPDFRSSKYMGKLGAKRRLLFRLLEMKQYWLIDLLFKVRG